MTPKDVMIQVLMQVVSLTGDVEPVDVESIVNDADYQQTMWYMSINAYYESGGDDFQDKVAVSQSVINRRDDESGEFRNYNDVVSIITKASRDANGNVIRNRCWYSWYCDGKSDNPPIYHPNGDINVLEYQAWKESILAAFYAYEDLYPNIVGDSTHYYNPNIANAYWKDSYVEYGMVGEHRFYEQH